MQVDVSLSVGIRQSRRVRRRILRDGHEDLGEDDELVARDLQRFNRFPDEPFRISTGIDLPSEQLSER